MTSDNNQQTRAKPDKSLCRHLFDDTIVCTARLAAYATSRTLKSIGDGEYYITSKELCKRDLLNLAISLRKLAEITDLREYLKETKLKIVEYDENNDSKRITRSYWDLIGNVIHSVEIEIIKEIQPDMNIDNFLDFDEHRFEIDAGVIIKSDKYPHRCFSIAAIAKIANDFTVKADEKLSDHGIYLTSAFRD